ncbi:MAG: DUF5063 domain-containing protein [Myxococcota bacterium]
MNQVAPFVAAAQRFCTWVESHPTYDGDLRVPIALLADLIGHGAQLPNVDPADDDDSDEDVPAPPTPRKTVLFSDFQYYRCVSNPFDGIYDDPSLELGDITDDIGDIYADLQRGLVHWEHNQLRAIWEWKFGFDHHWGRHAASVLNALLSKL